MNLGCVRPRRCLPSRAGCFSPPVYFVFVSQTKSHHFARTVSAGGASYFAAQRNASVRRAHFHELYALFSLSHFHVAFDVVAMLSVAHIFSASSALLQATWATWALAGCFCAAPFLYNLQALQRRPQLR